MRRSLALLLCILPCTLLGGCAAPADTTGRRPLSRAWLNQMFAPEQLAEETDQLVQGIKSWFGAEFDRLPGLIGK